MNIILTSHYLEEIEELCDHVSILSKGNLIALGSVDEIKKIIIKNPLKKHLLKLLEIWNNEEGIVIYKKKFN